MCCGGKLLCRLHDTLTLSVCNSAGAVTQLECHSVFAHVYWVKPRFETEATV